MPSVDAQLDAARAYQSKDAVVAGLVEGCETLLAETQDVPELTLLVVDYERGAELRTTPLAHTDSCKVILYPPTVLVAERFLLEIEAAVRSFGLARSLLDCQYLRSDEELVALAHRVCADLAGCLARLRRHEDAEVEDTMVLTLLFFVAHEVGHLLDDAEERSYATFIQSGAPLETRVANAAMKLCRHVDEFAEFRFDLPGFGQTTDQESDIRKREAELTSTVELAAVKERHERFFADEVAADEAAVRIVLEHLARLADKDAGAAIRATSLTIDGLFAAGLFAWYRDLLTFGEKLGMERPPDANTLGTKMLEGREPYVHAASLFGDEHRFTLLRATLAAEALLRARTNYFDRNDQSIWWSKPDPNGNPWWRTPADDAWWAAEAFQR